MSESGGLRTKGILKSSKDQTPLISIITVVYNGEKHIEQTIKSVLNQTYNNIEYIIIDGGSSDRTLGIIKEYEEQIDYYLSEKDEGIYDAMNKGIRESMGDYLLMLNADDWLELDALRIVADIAREHNVGYIYGDLNKIGDNDKPIGKYIADLSRYKQNTPICHQALFVKSKILKEMPFDTRYKIMADYDSMIKLIEKGVPYHYINQVLGNFRKGGFSSISNLDKERFAIQYKYFGLIVALIGFIKETRNPIISPIVQLLIKIKKGLSSD